MTQANGRVELKVKSWKGFTYAIAASSDLVHWTRLTTLTNLTGTLQLSDPAASTVPKRFYGAVSK